MGNKIVTVASIALAVIFVTLIVSLYGGLNNSGTQSMNSLSSKTSLLGDDEFRRLHNKLISGAEVIDIINNKRISGKGIKMTYPIFKWGGSGYGQYYSYGYGNSKMRFSNGDPQKIWFTVESLNSSYKEYKDGVYEKASLYSSDTEKGGYNRISKDELYRCYIIQKSNTNDVIGVAFDEADTLVNQGRAWGG